MFRVTRVTFRHFRAGESTYERELRRNVLLFRR